MRTLAAHESTTRRALVFGGSGGLGQVIAKTLGDSFAVTRAFRSATGTRDSGVIRVNPGVEGGLDALEQLGPLSAVVWAQGLNANDAAGTTSPKTFHDVMDANVEYVVRTLDFLVERGLLLPDASLCVVSSIWQEIARPGKFSYTISKAAVGGLVRAAALDLAGRGIRINAVLPGVVDTEMTRAMLSAEQYARVSDMTPLQRLTTPEEVAHVVAMLVDSRTSAVTGQSIVIDGGFSLARSI
jgi:NAD(P)-dependent dehydrogenase (short-subunit alcohol dehydrogenase family)